MAERYRHPRDLTINFRILSLFLVSLVLIPMLLGACGQTQPKTENVGFISVSSFSDRVVDGFKASMSLSGYVEGDNVTYTSQYGGGSVEGLQTGIQKLIAADLDLIISVGTPATLNVKKSIKGSDLPGVFIAVYDPVKSGIVKSLINHGSDLTGVRGGGYTAKRVEWLTTIDPAITRLFVPHNPNDTGSVQGLGDLKDAAQLLDVELVISEVGNAEELTSILNAIPRDIDAVYSLPSTFLFAHIDEIIEAATKQNLPIVGGRVNLGTLMAYGPESFRMGEQAGRLAASILQGVPPRDLPVETAEFFLDINLQAAEAIGLDIPDHVLQQASSILR